MNLVKLSWKNIINKPWSMFLSLILFGLGVGMISILFLINHQLDDKFQKNLAGIDLVIGAKGSPLQLILNSMYHIDAPTGNISIKEAKPFIRPVHPIIERAIPLSLGDSHKAYRIVGTTPQFLDLYNANIGQGKMWRGAMEVVIGHALTEDPRTQLKLGDTFFSSHGLIEDDNLVHDDAPLFKVVGILEPTGSVIDQLILCETESIWKIHGDHGEEGNDDTTGHDHDHEAGETHDHEEHDHSTEMEEQSIPLHEQVDQSITSILVKFKGRNIQALNMQRNINENTNLQAATPAIEINRLYSLMGAGEQFLRALAFIIVFVSGLSIFISLYASLKDRKYELALMRVMGSSRGKLFVLILLEGLILAGLGYLLGIVLSHSGMEILAGSMKEAYRYSFSGWVFLNEEIVLLLGALFLGVFAAIIPAIQASRTDISETLTQS